MELTDKRTIQELLKKYNARPEKYLGQHFILSKNALKKMIDAAEIKKTDTVIEIGPGLGTLTQELAENPACRQAGGTNVIAIEKDPLMISILKETLIDYKNVKIIQDDARRLIPGINHFDNKPSEENNLNQNLKQNKFRSCKSVKRPGPEYKGRQ